MSLSCQEVGRIARTNLNGFYRLVVGAFVLTQVATMALEFPFTYLLPENPNLAQQIIQFCVELLITLVGLVLTAGQYDIHLKLARQEKEIPGSSYIFHYLKDHPDRYLISGFFMVLIYAVALAPIGLGLYFIELTADFPCIMKLVSLGIISLALLIYARMELSLLFFVLLDNNDMSVVEALRNSHQLIKGHMTQLFKIFISFIGYDILGILSFGLGMFWAIPYKTQILCVFYLDVIGELSAKATNNSTINSYV